MITETNLRKAVRQYEENKQENDIVTIVLNKEDLIEYLKPIWHKKEITEEDLQNKNSFTFQGYTLTFRDQVLCNQILVEVVRSIPKIEIIQRTKYVN